MPKRFIFLHPVITDLIRFIKDPYSSGSMAHYFTVKQKLALTAKLYFVNFILILFVVAQDIILKAFGIVIVDTPGNILQGGTFYTLMMFIIICPVLEECIFRLPLSFKKSDIFSACFVAAFIILAICGKIDDQIIKTFTRFGILLLCLVVFYFLGKIKEPSLKEIRDHYGKWIVMVSMILFACVHISNITNFDVKLLPFYLTVYTFPKFCFAVCASFCRIHSGFVYGFLLHVVWNILPAIGVILTH